MSDEISIVAWAVYYEDGRYDSTEYDFRDIPKDGALCMVTLESRFKPDGTRQKQFYKGYDYYFRADGPVDYIYGCDLDSRERPTHIDIMSRYTNPIVIRGKWTDRQTLEKRVGEAREWQL